MFESEYFSNLWSKKFDEMILKRVKEQKWFWKHKMADKILDTFTNEERNEWWDNDDVIIKHVNEIFEKYGDDNYQLHAYSHQWSIVDNFVQNRATELNCLGDIQSPKNKICKRCNLSYKENDFQPYFASRLKAKNLVRCNECLGFLLFNESPGLPTSRNDSATEEEIIEYIQELVQVLEKIPHSKFGTLERDWAQMQPDQADKVFSVFEKKPSIKRVKDLFGSWFKALNKANVLDDGIWHTGFGGKRCIAADGHECLSIGEKTIDDFLFHNNLPHSKEPDYPEGDYRGDFLVGETIIEYFGMAGIPEYDKKIKIKTKICKKHKIKMIPIYPKDLAENYMLKRKLKILF